MPDYMRLMKSIKAPPGRHFRWARYDPRCIQERKLDGYDFVHGDELDSTVKKVGDKGAKTAKKERFQPGNVYVSQEGLVRLGDMVLMQTNDKVYDGRMAEKRKKAKALQQHFEQGGEFNAAPGVLTHSKLKTHDGVPSPRDE